jgi:FixJ family two-component response regulator
MGARRRLLISIVDDEAAVRKALGRLFSAADFDVAMFGSGQAVVDSLATTWPDCAVLDLHMPGFGGLDVLRHLMNAAIRLPVIIITGYDEPGTHTQCLAAGAAGYLRKPLDDQTLLAAVGRAIAPSDGSDVQNAASLPNGPH